MADALKRNQAEGSEPSGVTQIEPYPRRELLSALPDHWTLHDVVLQRADPRIFESLGARDICFYDGSHVARAGSDGLVLLRDPAAAEAGRPDSHT
jgi:hypothetical protein